MGMVRWLWVGLGVTLLVDPPVSAEEQAVGDNTGNEDNRWHPDKVIVSEKGDPSVPPTTVAGFSISSGSPVAASVMSTVSDMDDNNHTLNGTIPESDPFWYDENNTVEVSVSLALPLAWNLTFPQDEEAVEALVEDVSTAATQLFHTTLDHAITMLDGSPTMAGMGEIVKEASAHLGNWDKPSTPAPSYSNHTEPPVLDPQSIWEDGNYTHVYYNNTNHSQYDGNFTAFSDEPKEPPPKDPGLLWEWLGMEALSKEELYKMVLEYLEIEDEEDWQNASATSPLLQNLKGEIRQSIHAFFFQQRQASYNREERNHTSTNASTPHYYNPTGNATHTDWIPHYDGPVEGDDDDADFHFYTSGLWEMFLADTRVELVLVQDTYAWWQLTMIYPVYVHYQASYNEDVVHDEDFQLDDTALPTTIGKSSSNHNVTTDEEAATETAPYWVPVTDQGTLDFISRLLQRVLEAAVHSGAFLSSLNNLQEAQHFSAYADPASSAADTIVGEILALTIPGMEEALDELISPYDEMEDADMEDFRNRTEPPLEPPFGTYPQGLLDDDGPDRRQQVGILLALVTCVGVSGMVLLAVWRNAKLGAQQEETWLLGTDKDVAELLQVGWRQYDAPPPPPPPPGNHETAAPRVVDAATATATAQPRAEIIEVFDKSREGYYDNDSMLHGSAMQQSHMYDSCSEVPSAFMEYEQHLERHQGRGENNMFKAMQGCSDSGKG